MYYYNFNNIDSDDSSYQLYYKDIDFEKKKKEEEYNFKSDFKYNKNAKNIVDKFDNSKDEKKTEATNYEDNLLYKENIKESENEEKNNYFKNNYFENDYHIFPREKKDNVIKKMPLGKKRGRQSIGGDGEHNKFSDDNLRRKCKHLVLKTVFSFINKKIIEMYDKIGFGIFKKQLLTINQKQKINAIIQYNKDFLNKSLEDIFSVDISRKYTTHPLSHNKQLINFLKNDENINIAQYFRNLFKLKFIDCLKHFRGSQHFKELEGLEGFDSIKEKYEDDIDYLHSLNYYIMNYEVIINNKRTRKKKIDNV